ncbi:MAG: hypothetical protein F4Y67_01125 [Chloroflexi bacterium]|nr:hypothetical protein [Chloroflexota bacterium]
MSKEYWSSVPPLVMGEYIEIIEANSPVAESVSGRDCEVQALCELVLVGTGAGFERLKEASISRVNTRRNFFGEWTNDNGPFTEEEVLRLREQVKPWRFKE